MRKIVARLVEQHVAQAPAKNHAQNAEKEQVVEHGVRDVSALVLLDAAPREQEGHAEADEIHQAVPAHRQRADGDRDRIDLRMDQLPEKWVAVARDRLMPTG